MGELTVIWWRDIPAQVIAKEGRESAKVVLSDRFQDSIDQAATRVGLIGSDEYLAEWRRVRRTCAGDLESEVEDEAAKLEAAYPDDRLTTLIRSGGIEE